MRLQRAKQLIEQGVGSISEIAYQTGFNSPAYFTKSFREQFDKLPSQLVGAKNATDDLDAEPLK